MNKRKKFFTSSLTILMLLGTVAFAAGCQQSQTPGTTPPPAAPTDTKEAVFAGGWPYATVPTGHFNMFVANSIELNFYRELHQLPLATYRATTEEYVPMLAESWKLSDDKKTLAVTLRSDATWKSGEKFTAKDVITTFLIYRLVGNPVWNYIDDVKFVSDTEVAFSIKQETTMLYRYVLRKPMVDYKTYGTYADKVGSLLGSGKNETSEEWKALVNEFTNFRPEMVNATGPYYLDPAKVSESHVELVKNDTSFLASKVNFDKVLVYNGGVPDLTPLVLNKEVDYLTHQFPSASMQTFKGAGYDTIQLQGVDGIAMYINEAVKPLDVKEVRQAFAYVIDRNRIGELALPGITRGAKYLSGLGDLMTENWVDTAKLTDYTVNLEKAKTLLIGAGLTQKDGKWILADGKPFTLTLQCPTSWSDAATAASEIAQQLTAFGIPTTFEGIDPNARQTNINEGTFQLALSFYGTGQPHPMFAFETPLLVSNAKVAKGLSYPMSQNTAIAGQVNLEELIYQSTAGWDAEAQKAIVEKIVYTVNETVPYIPIYSKWSTNLSSKGMRTDWGSDEDLYLNSAGDDNFAVIKILNGELKPIK
ncbi:MAG TPA: ABC transporter substrate-binding protein [Clostridiaceae bacterium]|nr:ABC transporter substrate-binding protein [Clostridiaceae bacterium]